MADDAFRDFVLDQLGALDGQLDGLRARAMFGAHGIYAGETFFAIAHEGRLYFKTDQRTVERYVSGGMGPFRPNPRQTLKRYYEVPAEVVEDRDELVRWARESVRAAG